MPDKAKKEKRLTVLGERLNGLRGDVSQAEFARRIGLTAATVGYYENSERLPDAETLHKICVACDCTSDYLLGLSDVRKHDIDAQAANERYGLSEAALDRLHDITARTTPNKLPGFIETTTSGNLSARAVLSAINAVLTSESGLVMLERLDYAINESAAANFATKLKTDTTDRNLAIQQETAESTQYRAWRAFNKAIENISRVKPEV